MLGLGIIKKLLALVFFLVVLAVVVFFSIDSIAKSALEKGAGYAMGVDVKASGVDVGVVSGGGLEVDRLEVANPPGFSTMPFVKVGSTKLDMPFKAILQDVVDVQSLVISDVAVSIEKNGAQTNYGVVTDALKRFQSDGKKEEGKRYIFRTIRLENIKAQTQIRAGAIASPTLTVLDVKTIEVKDLGAKDGKGVTLSEATAALLESLLRGIAIDGAALLPKDLVADLSANLGTLNALKDAGGELLGGLKGLFGK
jgi:hypothetical protein